MGREGTPYNIYTRARNDCGVMCTENGVAFERQEKNDLDRNRKKVMPLDDLYRGEVLKSEPNLSNIKEMDPSNCARREMFEGGL